MVTDIEYHVEFRAEQARVMWKNRPEPIAVLHFDLAVVNLIVTSGTISIDGLEHILSAVDALPDYAFELRKLGSAKPAQRVSFEFARENVRARVYFSVGTNIRDFISEISFRCLEVHEILKQAKDIGSQFKRWSYSDKIDRLERSGVYLMELFGFGVFVGGRLTFQPDYKIAFITDPASDEWHTLEDFEGTKH